jgi:antitoxin ParD1/3/4
MPARSAMNVSLTPQLAAYVRAEVASGRYRSASEVVRASLRLLQQHQAATAPLQRTTGEPDGAPRRG